MNDEVNLLMMSPGLGTTLHATFEEDLLNSEPLELSAWRRRPLRERVLATLGRVIERHQ